MRIIRNIEIMVDDTHLTGAMSEMRISIAIIKIPID